jgi:hypothetical protein
MIYESLRASQECRKLCQISVLSDSRYCEEPGFRFTIKCNCCSSCVAHREPRMIYALVNIICCSSRSYPSAWCEALRLCLCLHIASQPEPEGTLCVTSCVTIWTGSNIVCPAVCRCLSTNKRFMPLHHIMDTKLRWISLYMSTSELGVMPRVTSYVAV